MPFATGFLHQTPKFSSVFSHKTLIVALFRTTYLDARLWGSFYRRRGNNPPIESCFVGKRRKVLGHIGAYWGILGHIGAYHRDHPQHQAALVTRNLLQEIEHRRVAREHRPMTERLRVQKCS